jgi:hypothetical protein
MTTSSNKRPAGHNQENVIRPERILMMVYVVQNYLASFGLCPSSGMVKKLTF